MTDRSAILFDLDGTLLELDDSYVETVVSSYEAGAHKPDPAPYWLAQRRLPASEYAMVGDSADDIEGAKQVGWTAYRYTGGGFGDLPEALDW